MVMKKILITGGTSGIGYAVVKKLISNYEVIFTYYSNKDKAIDIMSKYHIKGYYLDLSSKESIELLVSKIDNIDILINNASISIDNDLDCKSYEEFSKVINTNLVGTFYLTKMLKDKINDNGSIVFISSTNAYDTYYVEGIDYDASKSGIISLTHNFSESLSPRLRVNAVAPGWVNTPMNKLLSKEFRKKEEEKILLKRFAEPEEIANVLEFLISDKASYINNTVIRIDGGINNG